MPTPFKFNTKTLQIWRDAIRRRVTRLCLDRPPTAGGIYTNRVVFVRWDGKLGDSIVLSWVYRELARYRPDLHITVVTHASLAELHREGFGLQDVIVCRKRPGFREIYRLAQQVKHAQYVVHLTEFFKPRDFWFVRCVKPAHVVGLDDDVASVDIPLGALTRAEHFSQKLLPWLQSLGVSKPNVDYIVPSDPEVLVQIQQRWPAGPVTGFCPAGAGAGRQFSPARVLSLLKIMRARSDHTVMLLVAPEQREVWQSRLQAMQDPKVQLAPDIGGLSGLFATVRLCDVVVSVDTAVVHIAAGLNKPLLALYNPDRAEETNYLSWHPNATQAITVFAQAVRDQHIDAIDDQAFAQAYGQLLAVLDSHS